MIKRREFFAVAATLPAGALQAFATRPVPARKTGKVETVFKSPGPKPNGLQATPEGLWIIDQGDNRAYLVSYNDGKVLRRLDTEADKASGITFNGDAIWIASTYSREIVQSQAMILSYGNSVTVRKSFMSLMGSYTCSTACFFSRCCIAPAVRHPERQPSPPSCCRAVPCICFPTLSFSANRLPFSEA